MNEGADVLGVLRWGLRRYSWIVAAFVVALGVLLPTVLSSVPEEYEARAQVGPTKELRLPNLDPLPRLGESVFDNGAVAEAVRRSFDPALPATDPVVPERAELVAAQDNIVFTVVGRSSDPATAQHVANVAAGRFTQELNKYVTPVGSFTIQRLAVAPGQPVPQMGGTVATGIGVLAGLVAGIGVVALILLWRRPVIDSATVRTTTGAPVLGQVSLGFRTRTRGLPQLCRTVVAGPTDMLLLAGTRDTRHARRILCDELTDMLAWARPVVVYGEGDDVSRIEERDEAGRGGDPVVIIDAPTQAELVTRPPNSLTLLVVREGIRYVALRDQVEANLDGGPAGVVLVRGRRRRLPWRSAVGQESAAKASPRTSAFRAPA